MTSVSTRLQVALGTCPDVPAGVLAHLQERAAAAGDTRVLEQLTARKCGIPPVTAPGVRASEPVDLQACGGPVPPGGLEVEVPRRRAGLTVGRWVCTARRREVTDTPPAPVVSASPVLAADPWAWAVYVTGDEDVATRALCDHPSQVVHELVAHHPALTGTRVAYVQLLTSLSQPAATGRGAGVQRAVPRRGRRLRPVPAVPSLASTLAGWDHMVSWDRAAQAEAARAAVLGGPGVGACPVALGQVRWTREWDWLTQALSGWWATLPVAVDVTFVAVLLDLTDDFPGTFDDLAVVAAGVCA